MRILSGIKDEATWHSADDEEESSSSSTYGCCVLQCLDTLGIALGAGDIIFPVVSEQLAAYLASPDWRKRHAALVALAHIAKGCSESMINNSEPVVTMALNAFHDPHPRVRWAAIDAIARLSVDLGSHLQVRYYTRVLPALASAMDDFENPRVQAHAVSAVIHFSENCTPDILAPFLDGIVSKLHVLLQSGKKRVKEAALAALALYGRVAKQCCEEVLRSYETSLPFFIEACNDENSDVRQAAAYGLGVCAQYSRSAIKPLIGEALSSLNAVIRHPDALHPDNMMAYDNAVSALGKICHFHRDSIDSAQVIPAWLNCLPIKRDVVQAKAVHELLSVMVERGDAELLGPNNQYLPKIVSIFAEILCVGKDLASDQTISRISNLLRRNFGWQIFSVTDIKKPWMGSFG